jgi:hypothetical protein
MYTIYFNERTIVVFSLNDHFSPFSVQILQPNYVVFSSYQAQGMGNHIVLVRREVSEGGVLSIHKKSNFMKSGFK